MHPKNTSFESINNYVDLRLKPRRLSMCIFKRNLNISFIINKLLVIGGNYRCEIRIDVTMDYETIPLDPVFHNRQTKIIYNRKCGIFLD